VSFLRGLLAARSHLAFLAGLAGAFAAVQATSPASPETRASAAFSGAEEELELRPPAALTEGDRRLARAAWAYFERNTDARTGLTSSLSGYPSTTMWEVGSQLMATLAAQDLGVISDSDARERLRRALASLATLPLCDGGLPNKAYDSRTLGMVSYDNAPSPAGIGWSALDVGRVLVPLALIVRRMPELGLLAESVVARWNLDALTDASALRGATRAPDGELETYQEGRVGYEQYAAKALLLWGVPATAALDYGAHLHARAVGGVPVPADDRHPRDHGGAHNAVLSEPWVLEGLEFGFDAATAAYARSVLAAQERRFRTTGRVTAVSEDAIDRRPGFAYSAVLNGDEEWTAFLPDGTRAPENLTFSVKAALGWAALFSGSYPDRLFEAGVAVGGEDGGGLFAGRYDDGGRVNRAVSLNTNAVVLEALAYKAHGPLLRAAGRYAARASAAFDGAPEAGR
jgi:hypothetical protein